MATDVPRTPPRVVANLQPPTPIVPNSATSHPYTSTSVRDGDTLWREISRKIIGPMPADKFFQDFLTPAGPGSGPAPAFDAQELNKMMKVQAEVPMYSYFIEAFSRCCPMMALVDTHSTPFRSFDDTEIKPDICLYEDRFIQEQFPEPSKPELDLVGVVAEFKYTHSDDPFDDTSPGFERTTDDARKTLSQICSYSTAHMAAQFRTRVFSMLVFPRYARLLVWDRAGVAVTEKIDLETNASVLADFFWRYENMTPTDRGCDPTVQVVSTTAVEQVVPNALELLGVDDNARLFEMEFPGGRKFVVSAPLYMGIASPTGRSTRTFKGLCMQTKKIVFLKDTWRVISDGILPEHVIYTKLAEAGVPYVATLEAFHDVEGQFTRMHEFQSESWVKFKGIRRFRRFQHYRLVLLEYARSIQLFKNVRELVQALRDALEAHRHTHDKARILHRDISAGNVMITEEGRGLLVDFDLSKFLDAEPGGESQLERTGTWQFMAARLLELPEPGMLPPIPNRDDDLESFWQVLLWTALKRCEHKLSPSRIQSRLQNLFDSSYTDIISGQKEGGSNKKGELAGQSVIQEMCLGSEILGRILMDVARVLYTRYPTAPHVERGVVEVENVWKMIQLENPRLQESDLEQLLQLRLVSTRSMNWDYYSRWNGRRIQKDIQWMENVFETALNDGTAAWDVGNANVQRCFPCNKSEARSQKRASGEASNLSNKRLKSGLQAVSES